jgi:inhibitor of KinA
MSLLFSPIMASTGRPPLRFRPASDQSLLVYFGDHIELDTHRRVVRFLKLLQAQPIDGVRNLHPAYCSMLVVFDPLRLDHAVLETRLREIGEHLESMELAPSRTVEIHVRYDGPDLDEVAAFHNMSRERVAELHCSVIYTVYFLGFVPGFAYLGGLPSELATPRLTNPRRIVPAGSVGIAGNQTGVYPFSTPGGWRLIGQTNEQMFRTDRDPMSLLTIGDLVRFIPE